MFTIRYRNVLKRIVIYIGIQVLVARGRCVLTIETVWKTVFFFIFLMFNVFLVENSIKNQLITIAVSQ